MEAYFTRGISYYELGQYQQAIEDYTKAIELPDERIYKTLWYNSRGETYRYKRYFDSAIKDYEQSILLDPENPYAYYNLGIVYYSLKNHIILFMRI